MLAGICVSWWPDYSAGSPTTCWLRLDRPAGRVRLGTAEAFGKLARRAAVVRSETVLAETGLGGRRVDAVRDDPHRSPRFLVLVLDIVSSGIQGVREPRV